MTNTNRHSLIALLLLLALIGSLALLADSGGPAPASECEECDGEACPCPREFLLSSEYITADNPYGLPPMQLPYEMRERNYAGGSCVHASTEMWLRWQGHEELADWWRSTYRGGENSSGLISKCEKAGLRFACTTRGDESFLEWVSRTKRGATIFYKPSHSIVFCGFDGGDAVLLDNNAISNFERVPKATFISRWKGFGGFALTGVYSPRPPLEWDGPDAQEINMLRGMLAK